MKLNDFIFKPTAKTLNENFYKKFGKKLNLKEFSIDDLYDTRNKLRSKLSQIETNETFEAVRDENYQKTKMFLDIINAELNERSNIQESKQIKVKPVKRKLKENEEDKAELIIAAKDMVDKLTGWMQDTSEMQSESMLSLADEIRNELGSEKSENFTGLVKPSLEELYHSMEKTRTSLLNAVGLLTGESQMETPMGQEEPEETEVEDEGDSAEDEFDDFESDLEAAGGEQPSGREKRESIELGKRLNMLLGQKKR